MAYTKTNWTEGTAITVARLQNQEDGIAAIETYIDTQIATANTNVTNAKTPIATAISNKGVTADNTMSFSTLSTKIGEINAIKSIQQGILSVSGGDSGTTKTITLSTSVNTAKSIIMAVRASGFTGDAQKQAYRFEFASSTQITATRSTSTSGDSSEYIYTVIEFQDWVSVQSGYQSNVSTKINIAAVDVSKSFAFCSGSYSWTSRGNIAVRISSSTEIEFKGTDLTNWQVRWFVVDLSTD